MSDYKIEDIFKEKLFMLIPFYIFNYEKELSKINDSESEIDNFLKIYNCIFERLEQEQETGNLSALSYDAIIRLTYSANYKLTMKEGNVQKKVGDIMGGKVLDLPSFRIFEQGLEQGLYIFIEDKLEDNISAEIIQDKQCKKYGITSEKAIEYINKVKTTMNAGK